MSPTQRAIHYSRVVDLSHPIVPDMPLWVGDPAIEIETIAAIETHGYFLRKFSIGEHSGTHMNAPNSLWTGAAGIDAYSTESMIVAAVVIDIRKQSALNADYQLIQEDVLDWEQQYGKIPTGNLVLLFTGWQEKWIDPTAFLNQDATGQYHFPGFAGEVTRFLLEERSIAGVGIDTHGVDSGLDTTFSTNRQVLARQGIVLENLTNLDQLPPQGATLAIGRLCLQGGSGSPVSVLAFIP